LGTRVSVTLAVYPSGQAAPQVAEIRSGVPRHSSFGDGGAQPTFANEG